MKESYAVGVDFGATFIKIGLVDNQGKVYFKRTIPTSTYKTKKTLIEILRKNINDIISQSRIKLNNIIGVGIGVPGLVDSKKGIIHYLVNIRGWRNVKLKRILEKRLGLPVAIDNDVNVVTLGEFRFGAGKGSKNLVCLTLGTGIGGGLIIEGRLYRGSSMVAGEIGHIPINEYGPKCNCGGSACIERYVGNRYLIEEAKRLLKKEPSKIISQLVSGRLSKLTPEILTKAARLKDRLAKRVWREAGTRLGICLSGVINLLNPERIIIGGGMSKAGRFVFGPVRDAIRVRAMAFPRRDVKIVPAKLGEDAGIIGAAELVRERC